EVLQPSCAADVLDLRELVGRFTWIRRRHPVSESNKRTYVRSSSRSLVVRGAGQHMATQQVSTSSASAKAVSTVTAPVSYGRPLAIVTALFFMWGFLTCLNDILVPHLKSIFDLSYTRVMLIQFAFFSAYFFFSLPWSRFVNKLGYQGTMVVGLLTMAGGA